MNSYDKIKEARKELADMVIKQMEQGFVPSQWAWNRALFRPHNPITGARYRGGNRLMLSLVAAVRGYTDCRWMTYKQIQDAGYQLHDAKGQGVFCEYWKIPRLEDIKDAHLMTEEELQRALRPRPCPFYVFNGSLIDGLPEMDLENDLEEIEAAEICIRASECPIKEVPQERAYYSPMADTIVVPPRAAFKDNISFYNTVLHEMSHSTGHESRLNRDTMNQRSDDNYAREELRAELGSVFLSADLELNCSSEHIQDHSNYLYSWISMLKNNPEELTAACKDAEKIADRLYSNYLAQKELEEKAVEVAEPVAITASMQRLTSKDITCAGRNSGVFSYN